MKTVRQREKTFCFPCWKKDVTSFPSYKRMHNKEKSQNEVQSNTCDVISDLIKTEANLS